MGNGCQSSTKEDMARTNTPPNSIDAPLANKVDIPSSLPSLRNKIHPYTEVTVAIMSAISAHERKLNPPKSCSAPEWLSSTGIKPTKPIHKPKSFLDVIRS